MTTASPSPCPHNIMITAPLPPWIFERVIDGIPCVPTVEAENNMQIYAIAARADLEAENKRLREAMQNIKHMKTFAIETTSSWCPLATEMVEIARAALEKQP